MKKHTKPTRKPDKTKAELKDALILARDATAWAKIMGEELVIEMDANAEAEAASLRIILRLIDGNAELAAENERIHEILAEYRARDADVALRNLEFAKLAQVDSEEAELNADWGNEVVRSLYW